MEKEKILDKLNLKQSFGFLLNRIQDVAFDNLSETSLRRYTKLSRADARKCDGYDFILLNGQVFDWKEFNHKTREIVLAYLDYFNQQELAIIYNNL